MKNNTKKLNPNWEKFLKAKEEVKKLNKKFQKASRAEKRVMIAKDVIAQIKANKYIAKSRVYLVTDYGYLKEDENLQDILLVPNVQCKVCALGGMFSSCIRIKNDFKIKEEDIEKTDLGSLSLNDIPMRVVLFDYFSNSQLKLIEAYFEGWGYLLSESEKYKVIEFQARRKNDIDRLLAIMKNIIKNKGTFIP